MTKPVILGAGLAGVTTALALAPIPVILVASGKLGEGCSSAWAQGGIAAAVGADDSPSLHAEDTLNAGCGLNDPAIVKQAVGEGSSIIDFLTNKGVAFDRDASGNLTPGLEAAHNRRRIIHATDATGATVMAGLIKAVHATPSITVIENAVAQDIIVSEGVTGVLLRQGKKQIELDTHHVVLATGGAAALWRDTTNPHTNWGSGLALAARAGATMSDLEFTQFHPTAIACNRDPMPLASEALRGEGAVLIDEIGKRFTDELQPRDIVARAIFSHTSNGHQVFLDAQQAIGAKFPTRFPTIYGLCKQSGIDPVIMPIPVRPAAHYHMGGVLTDARGRTDVEGLWACGEVASTGLHGANRLASNSLLEAAIFGRRVAQDIAGQIGRKYRRSKMPLLPQNRVTPPNIAQQIRTIMSEQVGVVRHHQGLMQALAFLSPLAHDYDMALVANLVVQCALDREESRGAHFREDFPQTERLARRSMFQYDDIKDISYATSSPARRAAAPFGRGGTA